MKRLVSLWFIVMLMAAGAVPAQAFPHTVGPYRVEVDVRSSLMLMLPQALVKCRVSGSRILVSASAPGYVAKETSIQTKPGILSYAVALSLADKPKRLVALDFDYKPIASAYFEKVQTGTPPDQYAINLFLPRKSWPHPNPAHVIVNQPGYGIPIQNSCEITIREDFYRVRLLIDRAVLDDPNDHLLVYVNLGTPLTRTAAFRWLDALLRLETTAPALAPLLARALIGSMPEDILSQGLLPPSLGALTGESKRFDRLHTSP
jgi:hypothetical protein